MYKRESLYFQSRECNSELLSTRTQFHVDGSEKKQNIVPISV